MYSEGRKTVIFQSIKLRNLNFNIFSFSHSLLSHDNKIKKPSFLYRVLNKIMFPNDLTKVNKNILRFLNSKNIDIVWIENGITIYPTTLKKIKINSFSNLAY